MKRNLLYVSLFLATALVSCKSKEVVEEPAEEVQTEEVITEEPVVEDAPVVEDKKNAPKATSKKETIIKTKEVKVTETRNGATKTRMEQAKESKEIQKGVNEESKEVKTEGTRKNRFEKPAGE